jgi:hypothetical protein
MYVGVFKAMRPWMIVPDEQHQPTSECALLQRAADAPTRKQTEAKYICTHVSA